MNMRLENMKETLPETPSFIHEMVMEEVEKQLEEKLAVVSITGKSGKRRRWKLTQVAAVAALSLLGASTVVYAGYRLISMYIEKKGSYGISAGFTGQEGAGFTKLPDSIPEVKLQADYIPEGMEWTDEFHIASKETPYMGGFSFAFDLLDSDDMEQVLTETGVTESEKRTFGSREGIYLQFQDLEEDKSFNQRIYLLCPKEYRMLTIYIGDDVSKEEAVKVAENLSLVETGNMMETKNLRTWSETNSPGEEEDMELTEGISEKELKVVKPGEMLRITGNGETESGEWLSLDEIGVKVEAVQVADDLSLLEGEQLPEEWADVLKSDGTLKENNLSYIKSGDGIETLDQVVKTGTEKQKLLYITVSYENLTDTPIYHMLYLGSLMRLKQENGSYYIKDDIGENEEYDFISQDGVASSRGMKYFSVSEAYGNGGNYISVLNPGEPILVHMAWIVNEKELGDLFLNLTGEGGSLEFTDTVCESGLVDIRS